MRTLLFILLLPTLVLAQGYSRWNYSTTSPLNQTKDVAMLEFYKQCIEKSTGDVYFFKSYGYPTATDSSIGIEDLDDGIVRMFDTTTPMVTELTREDTLYVISKHSPTKVQMLIGRDEMLPKAKQPSLVNLNEMLSANIKANILRKAVDDSIKKNLSAGNTKAKRAKIWKDKIKIQKDKDKKIKANSNKLAK